MALVSASGGHTAAADDHAAVVRAHLRSLPRREGDVLVALAVNAVEVVADLRGEDPPLRRSSLAAPEALEPLLVPEAEWLCSASDDDLAGYLPALARALAVAGQPGARERVTSRALVDVIGTTVFSRLPEVSSRDIRIFDPAAGTGTLLLHVARLLASPYVTVCGQDINEDMTVIAIANAFLAGVEASFVRHDALTVDGFPDATFDLIVSDPPYGMSWSHLGDTIRDDWRYAGGVPRQSDSSLLFAQILASKLRSAEDGGGRAVMLCAPNPLLEPSGSSIREWLLDRDLVEAVVALPEGLSAETNIRLFALVMSNRKPKAWAGKVQVIDLRGSYVDAPPDGPERRRLSRIGLDELGRGLSKLRPSATARPVSVEAFRFDTVDVTHAAIDRHSRPAGGRATATTLVPRHRDLADWAKERYGTAAKPELAIRPGEAQVRFDISAVFPDPLDREGPAEIRRLGWAHTRLACLASGYGFIRSARFAGRDAEIAAFPTGVPHLAVPVEPHADAVVIDTLESAPDSRCFIMDLQSPGDVEPSFAAAWLNSPAGRAVRRSAIVAAGAVLRGSSTSVRTLSRAQIASFVDEILVPLPPLPVQRDIAKTTAAIEAATVAVSAAARDLWQDPTHLDVLRRRVQLGGETEDLAEWARRLPYPLAGALWVYETEKHDPPRAEGHLLRFWEATTEFLGVILLSALEGDPVLRSAEFETLRNTLAKVGLSLERATFGVWTTVMQRLAATFRNVLESSDADSAEKVLHLFGDPPSEVLANLLSTDLGRLVGRVNSLRNDWLGHSGATTESQARDHLDVLLEHTEALRDRMSSVWDQYRLVRAGRMARRGGQFHVEVELARGPTAPFRRKEIALSEPLEEGRLYMTVPGGERALQLNDLILLRAAPRSASYTCYFYNRREQAGVRLVAYQYAEESSVVEEVPTLMGFLEEFAGAV